MVLVTELKEGLHRCALSCQSCCQSEKAERRETSPNRLLFVRSTPEELCVPESMQAQDMLVKCMAAILLMGKPNLQIGAFSVQFSQRDGVVRQAR